MWTQLQQASTGSEIDNRRVVLSSKRFVQSADGISRLHLLLGRRGCSCIDQSKRAHLKGRQGGDPQKIYLPTKTQEEEDETRRWVAKGDFL